MEEIHPILAAIDAAIDAAQDTSHRAHLGASIIGDNCARKIWYGFRWVTPVKWQPRMLRLFGRGKLEEVRFITWLQNAGVTVWEKDERTGRQFRFKGYKGHFGGELDGVGQGIIESPYLLEFKTHGDKSFKELVSLGMPLAKPTHYVQMTIYMGEYKLPRGLYLAINKNTDEIYAEEIAFDEPTYLKYTERAKMIIDAPEPPLKLSNEPSWWECRFCEHHPVCHKGVLPLINCRTCAHSTPVEGGKWVCEISGPNSPPVIPENIIPLGCGLYVRHPMP